MGPFIGLLHHILHSYILYVTLLFQKTFCATAAEAIVATFGRCLLVVAYELTVAGVR